MKLFKKNILTIVVDNLHCGLFYSAIYVQQPWIEIVQQIPSPAVHNWGITYPEIGDVNFKGTLWTSNAISLKNASAL